MLEVSSRPYINSPPKYGDHIIDSIKHCVVAKDCSKKDLQKADYWLTDLEYAIAYSKGKLSKRDNDRDFVSFIDSILLNKQQPIQNKNVIVEKMLNEKCIHLLTPYLEKHKPIYKVDILLPSDSKLYLHCPISTVSQDILDAVCNELKLIEHQNLFGLAYLFESEYFFLDKTWKFSKILPKVWLKLSKNKHVSVPTFQLYFRVKFYPINVKLLKNDVTLSWIYSQLRQDLLDEKKSLLNNLQVASWAMPFAWQVEYGDSTNFNSEDVDLKHFFSKSFIDQLSQDSISMLFAEYRKLVGMESRLAKENFCEELLRESTSPLCLHVYKFELSRRMSPQHYCYFAVSSGAIHLFEFNAGVQIEQHMLLWNEIKSITFERNCLLILLLKAIRFSGKSESQKVQLYSQSNRKCRLLTTLCKEIRHFFFKIRHTVDVIETERTNSDFIRQTEDETYIHGEDVDNLELFIKETQMQTVKCAAPPAYESHGNFSALSRKQNEHVWSVAMDAPSSETSLGFDLIDDENDLYPAVRFLKPKYQSFYKAAYYSGNYLFMVNHLSMAQVSAEKAMEVLKSQQSAYYIILTNLQHCIIEDVNRSSPISLAEETDDTLSILSCYGSVYTININLTLCKSSQSGTLGLNITGGVNTSVPYGGIYVKSLIEGSVAAQHGGLQLGDRLLLVNGISTEGFTHSEAVDMLRNLPTVCHLRIERYSTLKIMDDNGEDFLVYVPKIEGGLGISVLYSEELDLVQVQDIFPHRAIELAPLLQSGDALLSCNNVCLRGLCQEQLVPLLRSAVSPVLLGVQRQHSKTLLTDLIDEVALNDETIEEESLIDDFGESIIEHESLIGDAGFSEPIVEEEDSYNEVNAPLEINTTLRKGADGQLGFSIAGCTSTVGGCYIRSIVSDPCLSDGLLHPGDRLLKINDKNVEYFSHAEIVSLLRNSSNIVNIRVARDFPQSTCANSSCTDQFSDNDLELEAEASTEKSL